MHTLLQSHALLHVMAKKIASSCLTGVGGGQVSSNKDTLQLSAVGLLLIRDLMWKSGKG